MSFYIENIFVLMKRLPCFRLTKYKELINLVHDIILITLKSTHMVNLIYVWINEWYLIREPVSVVKYI